MRRPSPILVVDTAILIAAVRGRSSSALVEVVRSVALVTTDRAIEEARRRIELGMKQPELLELLGALEMKMTVASVEALWPLVDQAAWALRHATNGANGSTRDAHILALAWEVGGDIWTTDRDFAGTGVATWSTPNLMRALAGADA